ncbi:hypothetical protein PsorP6_017032 [Peronosclerospora sorghi]|uniref:Uncharacterized protein n=1 Tax=Peronosclerospora sorghi TaxID=230839 RepID=A0ACC0WH29_9STRA|nr:hypothetical protein PsorP6_017032 [Peronosclerospora sorghi]
MFQPDNALARRSDRARVLELARQQREMRIEHKKKDTAARRLQAFVRGRLAARRVRTRARAEFEQKMSDILNLKTILQLPTMALPYDALFELLGLVLCFYPGAEEDAERLLRLCSLFRDSLDSGTDRFKGFDEKQRHWQLRRLLDLCLQCNPSFSPAVDGSMGVTIVQKLAETLPEIQQYLLSGRLLQFSPLQQVRTMLYSDMASTSVTRLVRHELISARGHVRVSLRENMSRYCNALMDLLVTLLTTTSGILEAFVMDVLSVPLLNQVVAVDQLVQLTNLSLWSRLLSAGLHLSVFDLPASPVSGIASEAWFLGNILWLSNRVKEKSHTIVLKEVQLLSKLLQSVPPATYAASGVAVAWTKVSESHSMPVVFPEALNEQLQILVNDQYLRSMCNHLVSFTPGALRHPLATERPRPMYPQAPTIAVRRPAREQFGFGDIASTLSISASLSVTWEKMKSIGTASWARNLFEKTKLRRRRASVDDDSSVESISQLENTSKEARQLAIKGLDGPKAPAALEQAGTLKVMTSTEPFHLENVEALSCLCSTFLFRWGNDGGKRHSYTLRLLNTLAFYHVEASGGKGDLKHLPLVHVLWCILQERTRFEDFSKMYEQEYPLPLCQIERIIVSLKHALHRAYWMYSNLASPSESLGFGMFAVEMGTRLLRVLYSRCSRQPFCNVTSWVIAELDSTQLIEEVLLGTPRGNKLIHSMPYLVPFADRVRLFQRLIQADKDFHQNEHCSVYRIRIRRDAILADGLKKLNTIGTNLKKRINVVFVNAAGREEVGIDAGGLFKEFWVDLSTLAFDLDFGLFLTTHDHLLYPNPNSASSHFQRASDHLTMFQFLGRILGKALYEGIVVQPKFAHFFLSKLLHSFNQLNELPSFDPEIYKNLMFLKSYDGDIEELCLTHTVVHDVFGEQKEIAIIPNGGNIPVTNENKTRYIHLVANYYLNTQIRDECAAFAKGLSDLIDPRWLRMFNEPELQVLIAGKSGALDVEDLKAHARYAGGYYALEKRVVWLWQALVSFSPSEQAAFLRFTTSCQRAPSLGFASLTPPFCVQRVSIRGNDELLPSSSTCFNTLKLPTYSSYKLLRTKLLTSIASGAGFEMT